MPERGDEREFVDAIESIVAAARKHGKWVGRLSNDGMSAREHLKVFDALAMSYELCRIATKLSCESLGLNKILKSHTPNPETVAHFHHKNTVLHNRSLCQSAK